MAHWRSAIPRALRSEAERQAFDDAVKTIGSIAALIVASIASVAAVIIFHLR
jgi:hypothetical protein